MRARLLFLLIPITVLCAACGGGESGASAAPAGRGEVWEIRSPEEQASVSGSIVAFVNVHVMVVDGERVYAGMTELTTKPGASGGRTIGFASGLSADLLPSEQGAELRFSSGERVTVGTRAGE